MGWGVELLESLSAIFFFGVLVIYLIKFGFSQIYDVIINEDGVIIIVFLKLHLFTIGFKSIVKVYTREEFMQTHNALVCMFRVAPLVNRVSVNPIVIETEGGIFRYISVTPKSTT